MFWFENNTIFPMGYGVLGRCCIIVSSLQTCENAYAQKQKAQRKNEETPPPPVLGGPMRTWKLFWFENNTTFPMGYGVLGRCCIIVSSLETCEEAYAQKQKAQRKNEKTPPPPVLGGPMRTWEHLNQYCSRMPARLFDRRIEKPSACNTFGCRVALSPRSACSQNAEEKYSKQ
jgi:hypothetical protein